MTTAVVAHKRTVRKDKVQHFSASVVMLVVALATAVMSALAFTPASSSVATKAEDGDWIRWFMCEVFPEPSADIYQFATTDDLPFELRSKSIVSDGAQRVDTMMNKLLTVGTEDDFEKNNEEVLGRSLSSEPDKNPDNMTDAEKEALEKMEEIAKESRSKLVDAGMEVTSAENAGSIKTPYDRFGVAGLFFTDYMGEWKYLVVDACNPDEEPKDPKSGLMYEERLAPQATWENRSNSADIRVKQSNRSMYQHFFDGVMNLAANMLLAVTKFIVVLTLAIINFSFTNVPERLGLNELLGGEDGSVFSALFEGIFSPLLWLAILVAGGRLFYTGVVQRKYREGMGDLGISLLMALMGFIAAAIPQKVVSLPSDISTMGQSLVISAVGGSLKHGENLCAQQAGEQEIVETSEMTDDSSILEKSNANIRSAIGCQYWENFLMRPWSEGQFGQNYTQLWAKGGLDHKGADVEGAKEAEYDNEKMVGKASVPLGGGAYINNWALFQVSTQTNVHAQINADLNQPTHYTNGIASDAWRIVDMLANYDEKSAVDVVYSSDRGGNSYVEYKKQKEENIPSEMWSTWVGNNNPSRIGVAAGSILVAIVGVFVPFMFSSASSMLSVALSVMMAFTPIMLLMGSTSRRGRQIFMSWLSLVLNTMVKRIVMGFLLVITLIGQSTIMSMLGEVSFWTMLLGVAMFSVVIWKSRDRIVAVFASFNYGGNMLNNVSERTGRSSKKYLINAPANLTASIAGATIGNKMAGGSFRSGLYDGLKYETKNIAYRNAFMRQINTQYEITSAEKGKKDILDNNGKGEYCIACGTKLEYDSSGKFSGGMVSAGQYLCQKCFQERIHPDATAMRLKKPNNSTKKGAWDERKARSQNEHLRKIQQAHRNNFDKKKVPGGATQRYLNQLSHGRTIRGKDGQEKVIPLTPEMKAGIVNNVKDSIKSDMFRHAKIESARDFDENIVNEAPVMPKQFEGVASQEALTRAWNEGNYEYVASMYAAALVAYVNRETNGDVELDVDEVEQEFTDSLRDSGILDRQKNRTREKNNR